MLLIVSAASLILDRDSFETPAATTDKLLMAAKALGLDMCGGYLEEVPLTSRSCVKDD